MDARVGQRVRIGISPKAMLKASIVLYIVPILALIVGGLLGNTLFPQHKDIWSFSTRVGLFIGCFLIIKAFGKHFRNRTVYFPTVTEVLMDQHLED